MLLYTLILTACTTDCGEGFVLGEDGKCYATPADDTAADTDTDTDADTDTDTDADTDTDTDTDTDADTDTHVPLVIAVSGTLTVNGTIQDGAVCNVSLWTWDQIDPKTQMPLADLVPIGGSDVVCPIKSGASAPWEIPSADTQGLTEVGFFALVDPDGEPSTPDAAMVMWSTTPMTVEDGGTYPGIDFEVTLSAVR